MDNQQMMEQQFIQQNLQVNDPVQRDMLFHDWTKPKGKLNWNSLIVLLVFVLIVLTIYLVVF